MVTTRGSNFDANTCCRRVSIQCKSTPWVLGAAAAGRVNSTVIAKIAPALAYMGVTYFSPLLLCDQARFTSQRPRHGNGLGPDSAARGCVEGQTGVEHLGARARFAHVSSSRGLLARIESS